MNKGGVKRKGGAAKASAVASVAGSIANVDLAKQVEKVRSGTHVDFERRKCLLQRELEKQLTSADRFRKLQIKNINELYDFEVEDAKARYEQACSEMQDQFIAELETEATRLANCKANGINGETNHNHHSQETEVVERALRSVISLKDAGDLSLLKERQSSKKRSSAAISMLEKSISDTEIRSDFFTIVQDIENRSRQYEKSKNSTKEVTVFVDSLHRLNVGDNRYQVGDMVVIYSALSDEHFTGLVTLINNEEVVLRLGTGTRFLFLVSMLKTGRITISGDTASAEMTNVLAMEAQLNAQSPTQFINHNN